MGWSKTATETECSDALNKFRQTFSALPGYESDELTGATSFPVTVIYKWDRKRKSFVSTINASGHSAGDNAAFSLDASNEFTADKYQLSFHPRYHDYYFDQSAKILLVSGSSAKMHGDYTLEIKGFY